MFNNPDIIEFPSFMWPIVKENAGHELSGYISRGLEIVGDKRKERWTSAQN